MHGGTGKRGVNMESHIAVLSLLRAEHTAAVLTASVLPLPPHNTLTHWLNLTLNTSLKVVMVVTTGSLTRHTPEENRNNKKG